MDTKVRAIIVEDGKLLLIHRNKGGKEYWVFPGGAVEASDTSKESALLRECKEELGVDVEVHSLFAYEDPTGMEEHRPEFFYWCHIIDGKLGAGQGPEFSLNSGYSGTYVLEWIPILALKKYLVFPAAIKDKIMKELM